VRGVYNATAASEEKLDVLKQQWSQYSDNAIAPSGVQLVIDVHAEAARMVTDEVVIKFFGQEINALKKQ